jgi:hypothetical protein
MTDILAKLRGRDRRSIGRSNEVVSEVLRQPSLFPIVFAGMLSDDPIVRMRSADAIEKITVLKPEYLKPFKASLLRLASRTVQPELRWHLAQILPRLKLTPKQRAASIDIVMDYLSDHSSIVRTFAMQALADFASLDPSLKGRITDLLKQLVHTGTPAMRSRGRKLIAQLNKAELEKSELTPDLYRQIPDPARQRR